MGNAGSQYHGHTEVTAIRHPQPQHWQHSLPSDPVLKASHLKVLIEFLKYIRKNSINHF